MSLFIVTLGFTLAISSKWAYSYFGLSSFEQIVYHIKVPLEGTNTQFIFGWMKKCLLPGFIFGLIFSWIPINIAKLILLLCCIYGLCGDVFCQILERRIRVAHRHRHPDCAKHFRVIVAVTDGNHFIRRDAEHLA